MALTDGFESGDYSAWTDRFTTTDVTINTDPAFVRFGTKSSKVVYHRCGCNVPLQPTVSQFAGGSQGSRTYSIRITYVTATGETYVSALRTLAVSANNLLRVTSPVSSSRCRNVSTGWNVYIGTSDAGATKQNGAAIGIGTDWDEPASGLIGGAAKPTDNTGWTPAAPALSQFAGGAQGARTYYVRCTLVTISGQSLGSAEVSLAVSANNLLRVTGLDGNNFAGGDGYNVYVSTTSGSGWTKQNATTQAFGADWNEPASGLIAGAALPTANDCCGFINADKNRYQRLVLASPGYDTPYVTGWMYFKSPDAYASKGADPSMIRKIYYLKEPANLHHLILGADTGITSTAMGINVNYSPDTSGPTFSLHGSDNELGNNPALINGIYELEFDQWYKIGLSVIYPTGGASNGQIRVWINDVLVFRDTDLPLRIAALTNGITNFEIGNQTQRAKFEQVSEVRYYDDFHVSDSNPEIPARHGRRGRGWRR